ncbi:MAG: hypothetical protein ACKV2T_17195 [Kofleriaceae bacterium]
MSGEVEQLLCDLLRAVVREMGSERVLRLMLDTAREMGAGVRTGSLGLVTVAEYARSRAISESYVRACIREGRLASKKIGRAVRIEANAEIASKATDGADDITAIADRRLGIVRGRAGGV